ncbi:nicotinate-nucleotide pyrophosphorylase (carboxylating) [Desulfosarcina sp. BuS5]|uniref:carboxylating nicotinate-nucleotide diphosphorylase n=1 Tax=Desulfosarcina sp. BuS5 TaxID=933262 RepID=UPI00047FBB50|nr:carboxylating nicotinate-nucleotide diphosphorylase [Desulfosarcina sp. BuS5]WDN89897.1 nicotinate-nucleotide pyrophosphorylase (carboxylating) [Desulfosarcina sp. BuS5]
MMTSSNRFYHTLDHLIEISLQEDIGTGDITTENLIDPDIKGRGVLIARESLVIAGIDVAKRVFEILDSDVETESRFNDGDSVVAQEVVLSVEGSLQTLLMGERTSLNFLQRLSGIATYVRSYLKELADKDVCLVDTRKTTPGWRVLEKYAVRIGGANNHRMGLFDGVLIKDNHIAVCGGVKKAVDRIRNRISHLMKIEVEVSNLSQVNEALDAGADVIMLDNMDIPQIKAAVKIINGKAKVEVSGGVTKENLVMLANAGVDIISSGALTHSAGCVDISMRIEAVNS